MFTETNQVENTDELTRRCYDTHRGCVLDKLPRDFAISPRVKKRFFATRPSTASFIHFVVKFRFVWTFLFERNFNFSILSVSPTTNVNCCELCQRNAFHLTTLFNQFPSSNFSFNIRKKISKNRFIVFCKISRNLATLTSIYLRQIIITYYIRSH